MPEARAALARRLASAGLLVLSSLACGGSSDAPPNLVLITIDTARADRIGCYGAEGAATPRLDAVAAEGALFERSIAVAPITLPSHVSLLTGRYPPLHGVRLNGDFRLPESEETLAGHLAAQGYATAGVVGSYVLSADFGIARGFERFDEPPVDRAVAPGGQALRHYAIVERPAEKVTARAIELLESTLEEPFFLWLHYYDPHADYAPPEPWASRFAHSPYDGEIAYTDSEIGKVLDALREDGRLDRTLLALTSDHGEMLGEHGENTHGLLVYEAALRVPLLLRWPGRVPVGLRSDRLVSGVDLAPTLLDLLGQPPMAGVEGTSFAEVARGGTQPPREAVYAEAELPLRAYGWAPLRALHDGRWKFIAAPERELYDLEADPDEQRNLAAELPEEADARARRLEALASAWPADRPDAVQALDDEARARLGALGYVSGGATPPPRADRPDPKRLVPVHNLLLDAQALIARGALPEAGELLGKALRTDPANPTLLEMTGTLLCSTGRCDQGLGLLEAAVRTAPENYQAQRNLGNALHLAGRPAEAAVAYRAAVKLHPRSAEDRYALGNALFAAGQVGEALAEYDEAARLGLDAAPFHAAHGVARAASGDLPGARAALERAVEADPRLADAWNQLGIVHEKEGRLEQARELYGRALALRADHSDAMFNEAKVCLRLGLVDEARAGAERLIETRPRYAAGHLLDAQIRLAEGDEAGARQAVERLLDLEDADPRLVAAARQLLERLDR